MVATYLLRLGQNWRSLKIIVDNTVNKVVRDGVLHCGYRGVSKLKYLGFRSTEPLHPVLIGLLSGHEIKSAFLPPSKFRSRHGRAILRSNSTPFPQYVCQKY